MAAKGSLIGGAALALLCLLIAPDALAAGTKTVSPLPESDYTVQSACATPAPGHASCFALKLHPVTAAARAHARPLGLTRRVSASAEKSAEKVCIPATVANGCYGLRPEDLKGAYFHGESPESPATSPLQTIALVDAYNDYAAEADLKAYDEEFKLPEIMSCKAGQISDCFEQINQSGERITAANAPFPSDEEQLVHTEETCISGKDKAGASEAACEKAIESDGWAIEMSTDIEVARAICQNCRVLLVEANSSTDANLEEAERVAVKSGATEVSNSWGGEEPKVDSAVYENTKAMITASAGDNGYLNWTAAEPEEPGYWVGASYPASSPHVIAVGGTKLMLEGGARKSETVWNEDPGPKGVGNHGAGGGGCSVFFEAPLWQTQVEDWSKVGCGTKRAVADVAADADPYTGVAIYDSVPDLEVAGGSSTGTPPGWLPIGGTSVASPIIASLGALAGGAQEVPYPAQTLYEHLGRASKHLEASYLFDVTEGGNGECRDEYKSTCKGSMNPSSPLYPFDCGEGVLICNAAVGYDGPTGVGTPNGLAAFARVPTGTPAEEQARREREAHLGESQRAAEAARVARERSEEELREEEARKERERQAEVRREEEVLKEVIAKEEQLRAEERRLTEEIAKSSQNTTTPSTKSNPGGSTQKTPVKPKLLALTLTRKAAAAARSVMALLTSRLSIAFTLSASARLEVTLARQVRVDGHKRWRNLPYSQSFSAPKGRSTRSLSGRRRLARGRYRLTLKVSGGASRSVLFTVG